MAALALVVLGGCHAAPRNEAAIRAYYAYDFTTAREELRPETQRNDEQILLNTLRLGLAALADGDPVEAERALTHAFELLSTAGLNRDRTTAAVFVHEGVRIWKGEPFEQALAYTWIASLYATLGDWENVRAAAANALFRLTDFGSDQDPETLARNAARDPQYLERGYTAVDTDFALGFLLQAIGSDLSGAAGARGQFEAALQIDPNLGPLVDVLRERRYDTLLIVDYGKGPTKIAYGPDNALAAFAPQERTHGPLIVRLDGREVARTAPVCNVSTMAVDHRWNNLEDVRRAKSAIGNLLVTGLRCTPGATTTRAAPSWSVWGCSWPGCSPSPARTPTPATSSSPRTSRTSCRCWSTRRRSWSWRSRASPARRSCSMTLSPAAPGSRAPSTCVCTGPTAPSRRGSMPRVRSTPPIRTWTRPSAPGSSAVGTSPPPPARRSPPTAPRGTWTT
jgi:tetratricopeptide (TPR) repeat protein